VKDGDAETRREAALVEVAARYGVEVERAEVVGVRVLRVRLLLAGSSGVAGTAPRWRRRSQLLLLLFSLLSSGCG
jgi:hypothetical protein